MTLPASGAGGATGTVLVSAATAAKAAPYVAALTVAGVPGESIRVVTPAGTAPDVAELAAGAAGLLLCGGADVDPRRYGEEPLPGDGVEPVPERDALEWELLAAARDRRLPVWAICRGFQVLNVFFGGSLWQDLPLQRQATSAETGDSPSSAVVAAVVHDPDGPPDLLIHAVRRDDQISLDHLSSGERVVRFSVLGVCSRSGRGKRDRAKSSRHHNGECRRAPETATHEPHHYKSEGGHCHDFHHTSHSVPSFPK